MARLHENDIIDIKMQILGSLQSNLTNLFVVTVYFVNEGKISPSEENSVIRHLKTMKFI